jgi:hypothetical protein
LFATILVVGLVLMVAVRLEAGRSISMEMSLAALGASLIWVLSAVRRFVSEVMGRWQFVKKSVALERWDSGISKQLFLCMYETTCRQLSIIGWSGACMAVILYPLMMIAGFSSIHPRELPSLGTIFLLVSASGLVGYTVCVVRYFCEAQRYASASRVLLDRLDAEY